MKRRFLSTLMALCLALSLLPTAAFAAGGMLPRSAIQRMPRYKRRLKRLGKNMQIVQQQLKLLFWLT